MLGGVNMIGVKRTNLHTQTQTQQFYVRTRL